MVTVSFTDTHVPSAATPSTLTHGVAARVGGAVGSGPGVAVPGRVGVAGGSGVGDGGVGDMVAVAGGIGVGDTVAVQGYRGAVT